MSEIFLHKTKFSMSSLGWYLFYKLFRRRHPIIYYAVLIVIFGIFALVWTMILTQMSSPSMLLSSSTSNQIDETKFSLMIFSSNDNDDLQRKRKENQLNLNSDDQVNYQNDDDEDKKAINSIEFYQAKIAKLQNEIDQLKQQQEQCTYITGHMNAQINQVSSLGYPSFG